MSERGRPDEPDERDVRSGADEAAVDGVPDTPNTDPDRHEPDQATGEDQARENRERESPA